LGLADGPRSASDLYSSLGDTVPLSSIYRTLAVLEDAGVVSPHYSTKGVTRYELAEWLAGHHHHLICVECGAIEDVKVPKGQEVEIRSLVDTLARDAGFAPIDHFLEIEGRCPRCK
jgi:Fur family ferric uptake transcriptional regulator